MSSGASCGSRRWARRRRRCRRARRARSARVPGCCSPAPLGGALQAHVAALGLGTLRLGFCWPLPEAALCEFLGGLRQVLVLEEGEPFLLLQLQALAHRNGISVRVTGPEDAGERRPLVYDEERLLAAVQRFAAAGARPRPATAAPAYDYKLARARVRELLRPRLDERGEFPEEPWALYLARTQASCSPPPGEGAADPGLRLLSLLRRLPRRALVVAGAAALGEGATAGRLADVQLHAGSAASVAGSLAGAPGLRPEDMAVALIGGGDEYQRERAGIRDNIEKRRDVLHVLLLGKDPRPRDAAAELAAQGLEVASADLADEEQLERALFYVAARRGPRSLLCYGA